MWPCCAAFEYFTLPFAPTEGYLTIHCFPAPSPFVSERDWKAWRPIHSNTRPIRRRQQETFSSPKHLAARQSVACAPFSFICLGWAMTDPLHGRPRTKGCTESTGQCWIHWRTVVVFFFKWHFQYTHGYEAPATAGFHLICFTGQSARSTNRKSSSSSEMISFLKATRDGEKTTSLTVSPLLCVSQFCAIGKPQLSGLGSKLLTPFSLQTRSPARQVISHSECMNAALHTHLRINPSAAAPTTLLSQE